MEMQWGSIADWVSGIGSILASIVALHLAGAQRRAQRRAERPEVSIEVQEVGADGWSMVTLIILNPAHKEWQLIRAEVLRPKGGLVTTVDDTLDDAVAWDPKFSPERRDALARKSKELRRTIRSVGTMNGASAGGGPANKIWERLPVFVGGSPARLTLRLSFLSLEPKPDRFSIDVERSL